MAQTTTHERRFFSKLHEAVEMPDLIEVQSNSYQWFLKDGLRELFDEVSPIVAAISPVPGGVGPMTVAALFSNLLDLVGNLKY